MSRCKDKHGNIFTSRCQTLVNTVNCHGVMGAGIALEFKLRYPRMFTEYEDRCRDGEMRIGSLWLYNPDAESQASGPSRRPEGEKWVLNFPTKKHWRHPSRIEYLDRGLEAFLRSYRDMGITSIAFPLLGATNGGIPEEESLEIMKRHLDRCEIPVEIYRYDPRARDDLYGRFKEALESKSDDEVSRESGLRRHSVAQIREAVRREDINSLSRLAAVKGIGGRTLERSFGYLLAMKATPGEGVPDGEQAAVWERGDGQAAEGEGGEKQAAGLAARSHRDPQPHVDHIEQLGPAFLTRPAEHEPAGEKQ